MAKPTILLADNDKTFLNITSEYLERNGFRVLSAKDPRAAKKILKEQIIALALIDYRLVDDNDARDESGYELARDAMKSSSAPRVILTKFDDRTEPIIKTLRPDKNGQSPAVNYLFKKDGLEKMLNEIRNILGTAKIFLCYAHADYALANDLYEKLVAVGFSPWMDTRDLLSGEKWSYSIEKAICSGDFFAACVSSNSVNRRGFLQKEIKMALEIWDEKFDDDIYLIPIRLEDCEIKDERLRQLQWVDLFQPEGFHNLVKAIRAGLSRRQNK